MEIMNLAILFAKIHPDAIKELGIEYILFLFSGIKLTRNRFSGVVNMFFVSETLTIYFESLKVLMELKFARVNIHGIFQLKKLRIEKMRLRGSLFGENFHQKFE